MCIICNIIQHKEVSIAKKILTLYSKPNNLFCTFPLHILRFILILYSRLRIELRDYSLSSRLLPENVCALRILDTCYTTSSVLYFLSNKRLTALHRNQPHALLTWCRPAPKTTCHIRRCPAGRHWSVTLECRCTRWFKYDRDDLCVNK